MSDGVLGVDFSGSSAAGDAIWVTEATLTPRGLRVDECYRAGDRWGAGREAAYAGLCDRITDADVGTVGLDFPFSLPQQILDAQCRGTWQGLVEWLAGSDGPNDPRSFSERCRNTAEIATENRDLRRETDFRRAALCPYTNRTRSMTFYGVRDVLGRLADDPEVAVVPMQEPTDETSTRVCEVYPAATFGWLGCYREGYKSSPGARDRRAANVDAVSDCSVLVGAQRREYVDSHHALDSLAAAVSTARVADGAAPQPAGPVTEGCIYV